MRSQDVIREQRKMIDDCPHPFAHLAAVVLPGYMEQLLTSMAKPRSLGEFSVSRIGIKAILALLERSSDFSGCYVLLRDGEPFYVGISRCVVSRLRQHSTGKTHFQATLAYRMACEKLGTLVRVDSTDADNVCLCGCGTKVKGRFAPGHDGRVNGWLLAVERGEKQPSELPTSVREALAAGILVANPQGPGKVIAKQTKKKIARKMTRDDAMNNSAFLRAFDEAQSLVKGSSVAFVEIENPLELYLFEAYCAMELNTYKWNTFRTH
jgi:hypothetical protein